MDIQTIILSVLGTIFTAFLSWATERLIVLINTKIKNAKMAKYLLDAADVVTRAVKTTYQTYVEALKTKNMFTKEAQLEALNKAKASVLVQLSVDSKKYIEENFGDIEEWVLNAIESTIYDLKNSGAKTNE